MAAPATVSAAGFFNATRAGAAAGEAVLRMKTAKSGTLSIGAQEWKLTGDVAKKKYKGNAPGSSLELKIVNRSFLKGSVDGDKLELKRAVLRTIPAAELTQFDNGPTGTMKTLLDATPDHAAAAGDSTMFWNEFGPVLYRGRLDGSARVLGIASDPGETECLPFMRRTLVGDSGQKTQGFLAKLGLTRSYVLVNAFAVALRPSKAPKGRKLLSSNAALKQARHAFFDRLLADASLDAIVAFGANAHEAYDVWKAANPAVGAVPVFKVAHPAAVDRSGSGSDTHLKAWAKAVKKLRTIIAPDADGDPTGLNYGSYFTEHDYQRIPRWDLPKAAPLYAGDDSWGRAANPRHNNCCNRPKPDDFVSILLTPAPGQGDFLRYRFNNGKLVKTTDKNNKTVATDAFGIPI